MSESAGVKSPSFLSRLFRTKNLDKVLADNAKQKHQLKKTLTAFDLVIFGVGAMIGAGIFALTGAAAVGADGHLAAGPSVTLSFILTGIVCGFCALCYSGQRSRRPLAS